MQQHKKNGMDKRDYISNLPNDIISNILFRLPTKYALRTCVLSKVWQYKWTSISDIHISFGKYESSGKRKKVKFANFLLRVLSHTKNLRRFYFNSPEKYGERRIRAWLSIVFRRNVEEVSVHAHSRDILPRSLLSCTSLKKLDLVASFTWKIPVTTYFPNLTRLHIMHVDIVNENSSTDILVFHFPVLETFSIGLNKWLNVRLVEIYAPKLISCISESRYGDEIAAHIVKIISASIQKFTTYGGRPENFLLTGSTVSSAFLKNYDGNEAIEKGGLQVRRLLKEFSCLKHLELSYYLVQGLARTRSRFPFSKFDELETLVLSSYPMMWDHLGDIERHFEGIFELLRSAPFLKSLTIDMSIDNSLDYDDDDDDDDEDDDYDVMESVPSCVVSHLVEVKIGKFKCETPQLLLASFLLKNGAQLKKFSILCGDDCDKVELAEQLSKFPIASKCLTIVLL